MIYSYSQRDIARPLWLSPPTGLRDLRALYSLQLLQLIQSWLQYNPPPPTRAIGNHVDRVEIVLCDICVRNYSFSIFLFIWTIFLSIWTIFMFIWTIFLFIWTIFFSFELFLCSFELFFVYFINNILIVQKN